MLALDVAKIASITVTYSLVNDAIFLLYFFEGDLNLLNIKLQPLKFSTILQ